MAEAIQWLSRITTIALSMVIPGLVGYQLDRWLHTRFLVLVGFGLGFASGMWQLVAIAKTTDTNHQSASRRSHEPPDAELKHPPDDHNS